MTCVRFETEDSDGTIRRVSGADAESWIQWVNSCIAVAGVHMMSAPPEIRRDTFKLQLPEPAAKSVGVIRSALERAATIFSHHEPNCGLDPNASGCDCGAEAAKMQMQEALKLLKD